MAAWVYRRPHDPQLLRARDWPAPPPPRNEDIPQSLEDQGHDDEDLPHDGSVDPVHFYRDEVLPYSSDPDPEDDEPLRPATESHQQRDHDVQPHDGVDAFIEDDEPSHDGSTDPVAAPQAPAEQPQDAWLGEPEDDAQAQQPEGYQQCDHDVQPQDGIEQAVEDDEPLHDGSTDAILEVAPADQPQDGIEPFVDDDELPHDGSTDAFVAGAVARDEDLPQSYAADVADDDALREVQDGLQQRDHPPQPWDEPLGVDDDPVAPEDGSTDGVELSISRDEDIPQSHAPEFADDEPAPLENVDDPAQPSAPPTNEIPQSHAEDPADDTADDLDTADDYDNTGPDQPWDEPLLDVQDDELPSEGSSEIQNPTVTRDENIPQSYADEAQDDLALAVDPVGYQQRDSIYLTEWGAAAEVDDDPELPFDGSTDPVGASIIRDENIAQSFAVDDDEDPELPYDGSNEQPQSEAPPDVTLPQSHAVDLDDDEPDLDVIDDFDNTDPDQPWDEPLEVDEDPPLPADESVDPPPGEHDVQPWDGIDLFDFSDEDLPHDGSTDAEQLQLRQDDIPQSFPDQSDDLEFEPHDGSTDPIALSRTTTTGAHSGPARRGLAELYEQEWGAEHARLAAEREAELAAQRSLPPETVERHAPRVRRVEPAPREGTRSSPPRTIAPAPQEETVSIEEIVSSVMRDLAVPAQKAAEAAQKRTKKKREERLAQLLLMMAKYGLLDED